MSKTYFIIYCILYYILYYYLAFLHFFLDKKRIVTKMNTHFIAIKFLTAPFSFS